MEQKIVDGIKKIRMSYARRKNREKAAKEIEKDYHTDVKAVLSAYDGSSKELLENVAGMKGSTSEKSIGEWWKQAKKGSKKKQKRKRQKKKATAKKSDGSMDAKNLNMIPPLAITCPKKDANGNAVSLVISQKGSFGCASVNQISPED